LKLHLIKNIQDIWKFKELFKIRKFLNMQIKKYHSPDFIIKEFETINLNFDRKLADQRMKSINFLTRKFGNFDIYIDKINSTYIAISDITKNEDLGHSQLTLLLKELALEIDFYHSENLIHGDIKFSNIIITKKYIRLIDWEPILEYSISNKNLFRSTMPYIASKDITNRKLTKATDRIAFFFLCKRLIQSWEKVYRERVIKIENKIINLSCSEILQKFSILSDLYKNTSFVK